MKICAVGDVAPRRAEPATILAPVASILNVADLCFGQMECPVSGRGEALPQARLAMRTPPETATVLAASGFAVMSIAGNHALDFGPLALADTLDHLHSVGIGVSGAGANLAEARKPATVERGGLRIALLARSSIVPAGYAAGTTSPGCAPMRALTRQEQVEHDQPGTPPRVHTFAHRDDLAMLIEDIQNARETADIVLLSMHWGIHFVRAEVADYQREIARAAIRAGADAILGHHPHLLKGMEFIEGKPVFYSLGNFAIEQPAAFDETIAEHASFKHLQTLSKGWQPKAAYQAPPETRHTVIALLDFTDRQRPTVTLQPCRIDDDSVPQPLGPSDPHRAEWMEYLEEITRCAGLATHYLTKADGMVECLAAPHPK